MTCITYQSSIWRPKFSIALMLMTLFFSLMPNPVVAKAHKEHFPLDADTARGSATDDLDRVQVVKPKQRVVTYSFKQMGASSPIQLRGAEGSMSLPFSVRSDEIVVGAKLKFAYSYSPALLPELSHLIVSLNDEVLSTVALPREKGVNNRAEINLDPRFFTDFNKLKFSLIGHYTYKCEDPMHSSLWLALSNLGTIELTLAPISLANDLKLLPLPFFDRRDSSTLKLPFVFASTPSLGTLKAAGITASWFGGLASYRGAQFTAMQNALPDGNAVVFLHGSERLGSLVASSEASVSLEPHPTISGAKLLVVSGRNDEDLQRAARAIALNHNTLSGQRALISESTEPPPRKPYDAPTWVPTDRPVHFGELARLDELQVQGSYSDVIRVSFRVAPDLFAWRSEGIPLNIKYRYTSLPFNKGASLNINLNDHFIQALSLSNVARGGIVAAKSKLLSRDGKFDFREEAVLIPPYQLTARNQLQLHYYFDVAKEGECVGENSPDSLQGAVDPDSTLDFSQLPHYAAMPNLAYFANIGFPFTRMADLAETGVVLPNQPNLDELSMYLALMGRMGGATGYPALRHEVVLGDAVDKVVGRDLIVIGSAERQGLMAKWADYLPLVQRDSERHLREPSVFERTVRHWAGMDLDEMSRPDAKLSFKGGSGLASIMAFESPLEAKRSVVYLHADKANDLKKISDALNDAELVGEIQGDFVVVDSHNVSHANIADTYYVGSLDWFTRVRWIFSSHPLISVLLGSLVAVFLAVLMYRMLRRIAAKRLAKH